MNCFAPAWAMESDPDTVPRWRADHERRRPLTKGERTRERLLRAAIARFGSGGFRATSVSQLSRDAGLTPAAAYAYFPDKETFWQAAVQADLDVLFQKVVAAAAHADRPIVIAMLALIEHLDEHPLVRRVMVEGSPEDLQLVQGHVVFAGMSRKAVQTLTHRQEAGVLSKAVSAEQLGLGFETVIFALVLSVVRAGLDRSPERVDAVVALLVQALGGPPTMVERQG